MFTVILKKKGYPITKEIGRVKEMLFTKREDRDWLYIIFKDDNNLSRSTGIDLTVYDVLQVKENK